MEKISRVHFVGIGGVGMGSLATALARSGIHVTGSDKTLYEPMRGVLAASRIALTEGYRSETVEQIDTDFVVIGNVISKDNPEAQAWVKRGTKFMSFPEAVRRLLIEDRVSVVCAGTHGKTTTTSWISFLLKELGMNPSYLIGGVPIDLPYGCDRTSGQVFVGEGDEYDSAYFDKGPKFLHYNPTYLVLSSIEFDHADIYRDLAHVQSAFDKLVALLPGDGLCVARAEDPVIREVVDGAACPIETFGLVDSADWRIKNVTETQDGFHFEVAYRKKSLGMFETPLFGEHNLMNLLSGIAVAVQLGNPVDRVREVVPRFHGARRRQEILMREPVLLVDDFAHHPTEVKATLSAVRRRFPEKRLWALFEPRSATARRNVHQEDYSRAFDPADRVIIASPFRAVELAEDKRFSSDELVASLCSRGKEANFLAGADEIVPWLSEHCRSGDAVVVMSNGEFGRIQSKIAEALAEI